MHSILMTRSYHHRDHYLFSGGEVEACIPSRRNFPGSEIQGFFVFRQTFPVA
jgi:hypothetical protein